MIEKGIGIIKNAYDQFAGDGSYIAIYLIAFILSFMYIKDKDNRALLVNNVLVIVLIIFNPIIASILDKFLSGGVYWRLFWCIPLGITIAYIFTEMIFRNENKHKKIIVGLCLILLIGIAGKFSFKSDMFWDTDNWLKLPDEHVEIVYAILENMEKNNIDNPMVFAPPEINAHIRQMTSKIRVNYERNPIGEYSWNGILMKFNEKKLGQGTESLMYIECDYFIWNKSENIANSYDKVENILETTNYYVYKINY